MAQENIVLCSAVAARLQIAEKPRLCCYDCVTSTNDLARAFAEDGAPAGTVVIAKQQTAGRGRQGRVFFSPPDTGLYLSMVLRPAAEQVSLLTPMAAVAAAEAVERCCGEKTAIKWVNDLLLRGKKICGILAESRFSCADAAPDYVVVGIGINLIEPQEGFPEALRDIAGAVFPAGADPQTAFADCAAELIEALLRENARLAERHYLNGYRERLCVLGRQITVSENGSDRSAVALDADDDLRLLVRYADGTEQWRSTGEIRIRL